MKTPIVSAEPQPQLRPCVMPSTRSERPEVDEDRARNVEALTVLVEALREKERRQDQCGDSDRDVDEEDPFPGEEVGEDAAEEHAGRRSEAADRSPGAQRDVPLTPFLEGPDEDRQGGGRDGRGAETLQCAEGNERLVAPREAAQERTKGEDDRAHQEDAPAAEEVGRTPSEQQESAEDQGVGTDHPLEVLLREPEVDLDRRQRDIHDRDVEDDHELHREDQRECEPFLAIGGNHVSPFVVSSVQTKGRSYKRHLRFAS